VEQDAPIKLAPAEQLYAHLNQGHGRFLIIVATTVVWILNTTLGRYLVRTEVLTGVSASVERPLEWIGTAIFVLVTLSLILVIYKPYPTWLFRVAAIYLTFSVAQVVANVISMVGSAAGRHGNNLGSLWDVAAVYGTSVLVFALVYIVIDIRTPGGAFVWPNRPDEDPPMPHIVDYLFISFNVNSTYGPTSEAVVSRIAKGVMVLQVLLAILMLTVLIARAVSATS
jgi:hypothetical protein